MEFYHFNVAKYLVKHPWHNIHSTIEFTPLFLNGKMPKSEPFIMFVWLLLVSSPVTMKPFSVLVTTWCFQQLSHKSKVDFSMKSERPFVHCFWEWTNNQISMHVCVGTLVVIYLSYDFLNCLFGGNWLIYKSKLWQKKNWKKIDKKKKKKKKVKIMNLGW